MDFLLNGSWCPSSSSESFCQSHCQDVSSKSWWGLTSYDTGSAVMRTAELNYDEDFWASISVDGLREERQRIDWSYEVITVALEMWNCAKQYLAICMGAVLASAYACTQSFEHGWWQVSTLSAVQLEWNGRTGSWEKEDKEIMTLWH